MKKQQKPGTSLQKLECMRKTKKKVRSQTADRVRGRIGQGNFYIWVFLNSWKVWNSMPNKALTFLQIPPVGGKIVLNLKMKG